MPVKTAMATARAIITGVETPSPDQHGGLNRSVQGKQLTGQQSIIPIEFKSSTIPTEDIYTI